MTSKNPDQERVMGPVEYFLTQVLFPLIAFLVLLLCAFFIPFQVAWAVASFWLGLL